MIMKWLIFMQTFSQKCETSLRWLKRYLWASDHIGMSGSAHQITMIQSLFVPHSGHTKPHSFPKAPLCHELSLNATRLSIDLLAMHFLSCFDVIVASVYGRFQIKLWRVLAFKPVISDWLWGVGGDYLAAVELTFFFVIILFFPIFWSTNWIMWLSSAQAVSNAHRMNPPRPLCCPPLQRSPVLIGPGETNVEGIWMRWNIFTNCTKGSLRTWAPVFMLFVKVFFMYLPILLMKRVKIMTFLSVNNQDYWWGGGGGVCELHCCKAQWALRGDRMKCATLQKHRHTIQTKGINAPDHQNPEIRPYLPFLTQ